MRGEVAATARIAGGLAAERGRGLVDERERSVQESCRARGRAVDSSSSPAAIRAAVFGPIPGTPSSRPAALASRSSASVAIPSAVPELPHALRRETEEPRDADELRQRLPLELPQLRDLARLDELAQLRVSMPGPMPASSCARPGAHERGDVGRRRADQLGRLPVGAHGVVAGAGEVEQRRVGLEPLSDRRVLHV